MTVWRIKKQLSELYCDREGFPNLSPSEPRHGGVNTRNTIQNISQRMFWMVTRLVCHWDL